MFQVVHTNLRQSGFFSASSVVVNAMAGKDLPGSEWAGFMSDATNEFLEMVSDDLEKKATGALQTDVEQGRKDNLDKKYSVAIRKMEIVATRFNAEAEKFRKQTSK